MREAVTAWAAIIAGLAVIEIIPGLRTLTGAVAVAAFLYVPVRYLERRGQDARDAGWRFDRLGRDLAWSLGTAAVILPLFAAGFFVFTHWIDQLPDALRRLLGPYAGTARLHWPDLSWDLLGQIGGNAAVAFAEEFFYRGYMTLRFEEQGWPPVRAALVVAALFAVGHLLQPAPWRLAVFFPALWFAWLRWRTGTVVGASIAHFLSNVTLLLLEHSAY